MKISLLCDKQLGNKIDVKVAGFSISLLKYFHFFICFYFFETGYHVNQFTLKLSLAPNSQYYSYHHLSVRITEI